MYTLHYYYKLVDSKLLRISRPAKSRISPDISVGSTSVCLVRFTDVVLELLSSYYTSALSPFTISELVKKIWKKICAKNKVVA